MKIKILESRYVVGIGYKDKDGIIECEDSLALALISQGIAEKMKQKELKHTEGIKEE